MDLLTFEAAREGDGDVTAVQLGVLYRNLLDARSRYRTAWPEETDFDATVDAIQAYRLERGYSAEPYADADYDRSWFFEEAGLTAEIRAHLSRVVELYEPGTPLLSELHVQLSTYARACREWEAAWAHLASAEAAALALSEAGPADLAMATVHRERALLLIGVGLQDMAVPELTAAQDLADSIDEPWLLADVLLQELVLAVAMDAYDRLVSTLEAARAAEWYADVDRQVQRQHTLVLAIGRAEHERLNPGVVREARELFEAVLADPELPTEYRRLGELWLADLHVEDGRLDDAQELLARVRTSLESEESPCARDIPSRHEVDLEVLEAQLALARGGTGAELEAALAAARGAFESLLDRWSAIPERDAGIGLIHSRDLLSVTEAVVSLTLAVEGPEAGPRSALEEVARAQAAGSLARALGVSAPSVEEVLASGLVPETGGLLVYLPGAGHSHAFCVDAQGISAYPVAPTYRLDPARRDLERELGRALRAGQWPATLDDARRVLSELLLPDEVGARIAGWDSLVVVGTDGLGYVPFELLIGPDGEALGDRRAVSYLPSLAVGVELARRASRQPAPVAGLMVVAAPDAPAGYEDSHPQLTPLPFGQPEEELLLGACAIDRRAVLRGGEASLEALLGADLRGDLALHLVAHGVRTERIERPQGLLLAGAGGPPQVLSPSLAESLKAPPMVVVTACSAWRGPLRRGDDGRHHLAGALFLAGARSVLISGLETDYQSTLALMGAFYEGLSHRGLSPAAALRFARSERSSELGPGRYLVHATGLATAPLLQAVREPRRVWPWVLLVGLTLLGAVALLQKRRS